MSKANGKKPWDRQRDESEPAYTRFLFYRNLGPGRTQAAAYAAFLAAENSRESRSVSDTTISGQWSADCARFDWRKRAFTWDVEMLAEVGREVVVKYVAVVNRLADKVLAALEELKPDDWSSLLEAIKALNQYVPQEAIQQVRSNPGDNGNGTSRTRIAS